MSLSSHIHAADVRVMLRLVGEINEIKPIEARQQHLFTGLSALVGGGKGLVLGKLEFDPVTQLLDASKSQMMSGFWDEPAEEQAWINHIKGCQYLDDPSYCYLQNHLTESYTVTRKQIVHTAVWYGSAHVQEVRRAAGCDDFIHAQVYKPQAGGLHVLVVSRRWKEKPFTERERLLVKLIHDELVAKLHPQNLSAPKQLFAPLPLRLQHVLKCLLDGKSEKETAQALDLSFHTVHSYVKDIYQHFGVGSRAELLALWINQKQLLQ